MVAFVRVVGEVVYGLLAHRLEQVFVDFLLVVVVGGGDDVIIRISAGCFYVCVVVALLALSD